MKVPQHQLQLVISIPTPAAAGLSSLLGISLKSLCSQSEEALEHLVQSPMLWLLEMSPLGCTRPDPGFTLLVSAPKWGSHLSVPPSSLPAPSSCTDFSLGVKMTPEPSLITAHLVPKDSCVLFLCSSYLSFLLFFQAALFVAITWGFFPINILFQLLMPLFVARLIHSAPSHSNLTTSR